MHGCAGDPAAVPGVTDDRHAGSTAMRVASWIVGAVLSWQNTCTLSAAEAGGAAHEQQMSHSPGPILNAWD